MKRVFLYVQHLLGIGHLQRAALLSKALSAAGLEVDVATGGMPVPDLDWGKARVHQLLPVNSRDQYFSALVDAEGQAIDETWKSRRCAQLLAHFQRCRPDALILETFPFGRRQMRFELLPLLELAHAAKPRPCIIASIRDILQEKSKPERILETLEQVKQCFDHVLVHGDPRFATLQESFPKAGEIADKIHYTGFVSKPPEAYQRRQALAGQVLVSAGGGAVGRRLLLTAMAARPISTLRHHPWRLLVGAQPDQAQLATLKEQAGEGVIVEPSRADFPALLASCTVSISQAGYNTVMDILRTRARSVLVPFRGNQETEQGRRAARLKAWGLAQVVEEAELTLTTLAGALDRVLNSSRPATIELDLDGAANSARLVAQWLTQQL